MSKHRVRLKELTEADVRFISLVNRSASRMPFRVVKQAKDDIDLSKRGFLASILKGELPGKSKDEDEVVGVMHAIKQEDGTIVFEADEGWDVIVKALPESETAVKPSEVLKTEVKGDTMDKNVVEKSGNNAQPNLQALLNAAPDASIAEPQWAAMSNVDKFAAWKAWWQNTSIDTAGLPVSKAEVAVVATVVPAVVPATTEVVAVVAKVEDEEKVKKAEADEAAKKLADEATAKKAEDEQKASMSALLAGLSKLTETVGSLATKIDETSKTTEILGKRVDGIARKSDTVAQALNVTVAAAAGAEDVPAAGGSVQKVDSDPRSGNFDTGMLKIVRKGEVRTCR